MEVYRFVHSFLWIEVGVLFELIIILEDEVSNVGTRDALCCYKEEPYEMKALYTIYAIFPNKVVKQGILYLL